jgi:hypothetical protein
LWFSEEGATYLDRENAHRGAKFGAREGSGSLGFGAAVAEAWTVPLPPDVTEPFEVFVNGVPQEQGRDYELAGRTLRFGKPLAKEGRLGLIRWASMLLGIAGTYRKNDSVDVVYEVAGRRRVAASLPIIPPQEPES